MKKFMLLAATAALFVACSSEDDFTANQGNTQTAETPIAFDALSGKATTRATYGSVTTDVLKTSSDGFGIFGYHAEGTTATYSTTDGSTPRTGGDILAPKFMYNQQVIYSGSDWTYDPIKYWPNETGSNSANSTDVEELTFFAYAPFIKVTPATGVPVAYTAEALNDTRAHQGITAVTSNTTKGDPKISFTVPDDPAKQTDLLWGTVPNDAAYTTWDNVTATDQPFQAGNPWIDVMKPNGSDSKAVKFQFKHALAKFNFLIDAYVDGVDGTNPVAPKTKIYVREVTLNGPVATTGVLNLNNYKPTPDGKPNWATNLSGTAFTTLQDYNLKDGLTDDKEVSWITTATGAEATPFQVITTTVVNETAGTGTLSTEADHAAKTTTSTITYTYSAGKWTAGTPAVSTIYHNTTQTEGTTVSYGSGVAVANFVDPAESGVLNGTIIQGGSGVTNTPVNLLKGGDDTSIMLIPTGVGGTPKLTIKYDVETTDNNLAGTLTNPLANGSVIENVIYKNLTTIASIEAGKEYTIRIHLGMTSVKVDAEVTDWASQTPEDINLPHNDNGALH